MGSPRLRGLTLVGFLNHQLQPPLLLLLLPGLHTLSGDPTCGLAPTLYPPCLRKVGLRHIQQPFRHYGRLQGY